VNNNNIIECRDCGGRISKRASHCPHCGAPSIEEEKRVLLEKKQLLLEKKDLLESQRRPSGPRCRDCEGLISFSAKICPHCGAQDPTLYPVIYFITSILKLGYPVLFVLACGAVLTFIAEVYNR
jgi:RNA polymerase subunit RPABC4/transcription elongation factor Spt4